MPLRKMNIDRELILNEAKNIPPKRKISYYRWIISVCKCPDVDLAP
jgi:hypothetical protein